MVRTISPPQPSPASGSALPRWARHGLDRFPCPASPSVYRQRRAEKTRKPYSGALTPTLWRARHTRQHFYRPL